MIIRSAVKKDLPTIIAIEQACFPSAEAATAQSLAQRLDAFGERFLVAVDDNDNPIGFINGCLTNQTTITDDLFVDITTHQPDGAYQAIFDLDILPSYRRQGIAAQLMKALITLAQNGGQKGVILTCKEHLIAYYAKFGFQNAGVSQSVHGGAIWYDMLLSF